MRTARTTRRSTVERDAGRHLLLPCACVALVLAGWFLLRPVNVGVEGVSCGSAVEVGLHREQRLTAADLFGRSPRNAQFRAHYKLSALHGDCWANARRVVVLGEALVILAAVLVMFWVLWRRVESSDHSAREAGPPTAGPGRVARLPTADVLVYCILAGTFLVVAGVAGRSLRPGQQWRFTRSVDLVPVLVSALLLCGVFAMISAAIKLVCSFERSIVLLTAMSGSLVQLLIFDTGTHSLDALVRGNDFRAIAVDYNSRYLLRHYTQLVIQLPLHQRSNMPGKVVLYRTLFLLTTSDIVLAFIILLFSTLGGVLLYHVGRRLYLSRRAALCAMALYFLIPARTTYLPSLNNVTPLLGLGMLLLLLIYRDTRRDEVLVGLGALLYLTLIFEPSPLLLLPVGCALLVVPATSRRLVKQKWVSLLLFPLGAFLCIHLAMTFGLGFNIFSALGHVVQDSQEFNRTVRPHYGDWPILNIREFFVNAGYGMSLVFLAIAIAPCATRASRAWRRRSQAGGEPEKASVLALPTTEMKVLAGGLVAEIFVLDLLGVNRGEVSRLWLYVAVLVPLVVASQASGPSGRRLVHIVLLSSLVQAVFTLRMVSFTYLDIYDVVPAKRMLHHWTWTIDAFVVLFLGYMAARAVRADDAAEATEMVAHTDPAMDNAAPPGPGSRPET